MKRFHTKYRLASCGSVALMLLVARGRHGLKSQRAHRRKARSHLSYPSRANHQRVAPLSWARHPSPARRPASTR
jgi:hypothetical protein